MTGASGRRFGARGAWERGRGEECGERAAYVTTMQGSRGGLSGALAGAERGQPRSESALDLDAARARQLRTGVHRTTAFLNTKNLSR